MTTTTMTTAESSPTITQSPVLAATDKDAEISQILHRSSTVASPERPDRRNRHSKRLSLNFPILIPNPQDGTYTNGNTPLLNQSPTTASSYRNGSPMVPFPLPSPDESVEYHSNGAGMDFLTLIAGQERRVMELKEELYKAETFLSGLKHQWTAFEAKKKDDELRTKTVKLGPVSPSNATSNVEDEEAERDRKREAREKRLRDLGMTEGDLDRSNSKGKRNGQRVLAGRHTRTLSLLQNNPAVVEAAQNAVASKTKPETPPMNFELDGTISTPIIPDSNDFENRRPMRLSISRQSTLQDLVATATSAQAAAQINLGKTYKELASAGRKSLPPGTDLLVKQGKQVYDGVSQGFWSFVEDIRQATVGDEPVNGAPVVQPKEAKKTKGGKKTGDQSSDKPGKPGSKQEAGKKSKAADNHKPEKDVFWQEFGIETPKPNRKVSAKAAKQASAARAEKENTAPVKDHESKSSTDSKHPPSLLADLMDVNDDDDTWDNWPADSPMNQRRKDNQVKIRAPSDDSDSEDIAKIRSRPRKGYTTKKGSISASWGRSHELD